MPRILILSTTFYPDPRVGAVRMSEWAKSLPEFGWTPHVLCKHYGFDATDNELAEAIHPEVRITYLGSKQSKTSPKQASSHVKRTGLRGAVRLWLEKTVVPDVSLISWRKLASEAISQAKEIRPDVVLSSSPNHSIHWLGRRLAQETGAKWVADFRDPYLIDPRFRPAGWRKPLWHLHKRYEQGVYYDADLTIHAIPLHGRWAAQAYPFARNRVRVLPNGSPRNQRPQIESKKIEPTKGVSLRSVGYLAPEAPARLSDAIQELVTQGVDISFRHAGDPPSTVADLTEAVSDRMRFLGRLPHAEALQLMEGADLLIAYLSEERSKYLGLSSKLFEYLAVGKPVIVINPTRPDRQLVRQIPWFASLTHPTSGELAMAVSRLMDEAKEKTKGPSPAQKAALIAKYDRHNQTRQLAGWLDELLN